MHASKERAAKIADRTLATGAIQVNTTHPFKWASGTFNPFYNNNRKLLDLHEDRLLVGNGLIQLADEKGLTYDAVLGTSLAGIGPAATVAELTKKLLIINVGRKFYQFKHSHFMASQFTDMLSIAVDKRSTLVAATAPIGIAFGVWLANKNKKRFAYVREKAKDHGLQKQIEGNPLNGDTAFLANYFLGKDSSYRKQAEEALKAEGISCHTTNDTDFSELPECAYFKEINVTGLRVLVIEDLVSTGGSSFKEVRALRDAGAIAKALLSIFSYGLPEEVIFPNNNCIFDSLLTFKDFLPIAVGAGKISKDEETVLNAWYSNQKNWGNENGFPAVVQ